jgi:hypothetical protein
MNTSSSVIVDKKVTRLDLVVRDLGSMLEVLSSIFNFIVNKTVHMKVTRFGLVVMDLDSMLEVLSSL